jgi:AcrR family transcriptional regulator
MNHREQLIDAALSVYAELGSRGATTRRIAEVAGVNEVTLFRHFGSKEALIREALDQCAGRALAIRLPAQPGDPRADLLAFCLSHHRGMFQMRSLIRKSMAEFEERPEVMAMARRITNGVQQEVRDYLDRLREAGLARGPWTTPTATSMLLGVVFADAVGRDCMPEHYPQPAAESVADYVELFVRAITT